MSMYHLPFLFRLSGFGFPFVSFVYTIVRLCGVPMGRHFLSFSFILIGLEEVHVYVKSNLPVLVYLGWARLGLAKRKALISDVGRQCHFSIWVTAAFHCLARKRDSGLLKAVNRVVFPLLISPSVAS